MKSSASIKARCAVLLALAATRTLAQSTATPAKPSDPASEPLILLDPFTVVTDQEGYQATDTLGGARVRTKLVDTPSSISVVTPKLMKDLGINNAQDLLIYTTNTEIAGLNGNYSGVTSRGFGAVGAAEGPRLANPGSVNRARGLTAMDNTRNYFLSEIPWDSYNISRVDISRGPNSFLFGVGSPSGIANVSTNEATFKDQGSIEAHIGSFSTTRESLDYNKVLLKNELAVRMDLLNDETRFRQDPAYSNSKRAYGTARYEPKLLDTPWSHTKLQFSYEYGQVDSNNPRELPPLDYISGYFSPGFNKSGYNPFTYNPGSAPYDLTTSPWVTNNDIHYAWGNNATYWYDATTGNLLRASQGGVGGGTPSVAGLNGISNAYHLYTTGFSQYAISSNYTNKNLYPGAFDKTVNYLDKSLTDRSIFDYVNKLIDGPNKHEWQDWNAYNLSLVQSLLNNHLVFQGVIDHQEYKRGQEGIMMGYITPFISVDLDTHLLTYPSWQTAQASANPNVGRPFIGSDSAGGNGESRFVHNNYQLTATGSLNFEEILGRGTTATILGRQEFTGLVGKYTTRQEDRTWQLYATDGAYGTTASLGTTLAANNVNWVTYLGPSLAKASSASGANISNIATRVQPMSGPVTVFSNRWTAGTSVDPNAAWVNPLPTGSVTMKQSDNPANYAGYLPLYANLLTSGKNLDQLYTKGSKSEQVLTSSAFMYQGYFLDETILPSFGWRRDKILQRGNQASIDSVTGIASMNYPLSDTGVIMNTTSKSYGVALHLPKSIKNRLPEGTDVSLFYFHGSNQTPRVRYGIDGTMLPNESGTTDDYSIQIDALKGRASLRLSYFKTIDKNAAASYGQPLGAAGWMIDSLPTWTLTMAAAGAAAATTPVEKLPQDLQWQSWYWNWAVTNPGLASKVATAIQKEFPVLFPQSYWDQYGLPVNVSAISSGDWLHVLKNNVTPLAWNVNNTHTIHGTTPIIDQDIVSKGYELEATVRPVRNWDITFNASKVRAYQTSLGAGADKYLNGMARVWLNTDVGLTPIWGDVNNTAAKNFMGNIWAPYLTQIALNGTDQPELRKWSFKTISNYNFEKGWLKGFNVGGAYRWASKAILGYGIKQTTLFGNSAWIADVNKPIYGPTDSHVDMWIGYQHKLTNKVTWRLQLNVKNVGEKPGLTPISVEPDGTYAQQRIQLGQAYDLSCKLSF